MPLKVSHHPAKLGGQTLKPWKYNVFGVSYDHTTPRDQRVMRLYKWEPLMVSIQVSLDLIGVSL